jgi:hypothetical protein
MDTLLDDLSFVFVEKLLHFSAFKQKTIKKILLEGESWMRKDPEG